MLSVHRVRVTTNVLPAHNICVPAVSPARSCLPAPAPTGHRHRRLPFIITAHNRRRCGIGSDTAMYINEMYVGNENAQTLNCYNTLEMAGSSPSECLVYPHVLKTKTRKKKSPVPNHVQREYIQNLNQGSAGVVNSGYKAAYMVAVNHLNRNQKKVAAGTCMVGVVMQAGGNVEGIRPVLPRR